MEKAYYIVCLEEASHEDSLLFWRPGGAGYTSNIDEAGLFNEEEANDMNRTGRDIALTKEEILAIDDAKIHTLMRCPLYELKDMKKKLKKKR